MVISLRSIQPLLKHPILAIPNRAFSFKAQANKLSAEQQEVEELTDGQVDLQLLSNEQIKQLAAESGWS